VSAVLRHGRRLNDRVSVASYVAARYHRGYPRNPDFVGREVTAETEAGSTVVIPNKFDNEEEGRNAGVVSGIDLLARITDKLTLTGNAWYQNSSSLEYSLMSFAYPDSGGPPPPDSVWLEDSRYENTLIHARLDYRFNDTHQAFFNAYWFKYLSAYLPATDLGHVSPTYGITEFEVQDNLLLLRDRAVSLEMIGGANLRIVDYDINERESSSRVFVDPVNTEYLAAVFMQDKLSFMDMVDLIAGVKAEIWTLVGGLPADAWEESEGAGDFLRTYPEYSPSLRVSVRPLEKLTAWGAWSRSVTVPAYVHTNIEQRRHAIYSATSSADSLSRAYGRPAEDILAEMDIRPGYGKWVAMVSPEKLEPTTYRTTECGIRSSLLPRVFVDISFFHALIEDGFTASSFDSTLSTVVPSRLSPGDSIVPIKWGNSEARERRIGGETVIGIRPAEFLKCEVSHAWSFRRKQTPGEDEWYTPARLLTPEHVVRWRLYLDLPLDLHVTVNGLFHSAYDNIHPYDFVNQKHVVISDDVGGVMHEPGVQLDFMVEKMFLDERLSFFFWGNDILADHEIESYYWYVQTYPHTIHRTFGGGISYQF
jgi:hypothetical protein